eukprot:scaffold133562_cov19-Tisochrysis_lutea.AAC.1
MASLHPACVLCWMSPTWLARAYALKVAIGTMNTVCAQPGISREGQSKLQDTVYQCCAMPFKNWPVPGVPIH